MKFKSIKFLLTALAILLITNANAQIFQISANGYSGSVVGDFAKTEINTNGAGYTDFTSGASLEFKYYFPSKLGLGITWDYTDYFIDTDTYQSDMKQELVIVDNNYVFTQTSSYVSFGSQLSISYIITLSEKWNLEPCFGLGFQLFFSPAEQAVYSLNSVTYAYRKYATEYFGFSYSPGLKAKWNISKHVGLNVFLEYDGVSLESGIQESVVYSHDSFEKNSTNQTFKPNSINLGLGFAYSFGNGLNK